MPHSSPVPCTLTGPKPSQQWLGGVLHLIHADLAGLKALEQQHQTLELQELCPGTSRHCSSFHTGAGVALVLIAFPLAPTEYLTQQRSLAQTDLIVFSGRGLETGSYQVPSPWHWLNHALGGERKQGGCVWRALETKVLAVPLGKGPWDPLSHFPTSRGMK